jgi:lysophospholipase L1-like esterase
VKFLPAQWRLPAAVLSAVAFLGGCGDTPRLPRIGPDAVILAFGDSLTHGTGAAETESYPAVLARLTGRTVINAGVPGEISADGLARLPAMLDEHRPALLILCHGGNDFLQRLDATTTAAHVRRMIDLARDRGIGVLLLGVPQFGLFLNVAPFYDEVAEESGVPYLGAVIPEVLGDRSLKSDTVHPNAAGYRMIAEAVYQELRDAGAF